MFSVAKAMVPSSRCPPNLYLGRRVYPRLDAGILLGHRGAIAKESTWMCRLPKDFFNRIDLALVSDSNVFMKRLLTCAAMLVGFLMMGITGCQNDEKRLAEKKDFPSSTFSIGNNSVTVQVSTKFTDGTMHYVFTCSGTKEDNIKILESKIEFEVRFYDKDNFEVCSIDLPTANGNEWIPIPSDLGNNQSRLEWSSYTIYCSAKAYKTISSCKYLNKQH